VPHVAALDAVPVIILASGDAPFIMVQLMDAQGGLLIDLMAPIYQTS
jgi:hypothetical protein